MSRLAGLDRQAGRRACVGAECAQCCALGLPQNEPYSPPLHSDASFKTSFELDYSYVSFPNMKRLRTGAKTGGICYEHEVLWIGRRRLLRTERIILLADHSIFARSLLQTFIRPPPLANDFFKGENSLHSTLCVDKLSASLSLSSVPLIRFWFSFSLHEQHKKPKV